VTDEDRAQHKAYNQYLAAVEEMLARTDSPHATWMIVEANDRHHARQKVFETIIGLLEAKLGARVNGGSRAKAKARPKSTRAKAANAKGVRRSGAAAKRAPVKRVRRSGAALPAPRRKR
jgi:polyphosphate kinase 2 PPK2